jgi:hypothetical protein
MSTIYLDPISQQSSKKLPPTGTLTNVLPSLPGAVYTSSAFITGAVNAVAQAYEYYAGNMMDIELEEKNIYSLYQLAILKYSYLINTHHANNILYEMLGFQTASFNSNGNITEGQDISLKNPNFSLAYARNVAAAYGAEIGVGGSVEHYSASFNVIIGQQDYDLQSLMSASTEFSGVVAGKRILVKDVFFRTGLASWRFFGIYGGYGSIAGQGSYSNYANNSSFYLNPVWENKLQAANFEDRLWTRTSHYSYEIINNKIRIYPIPTSLSPSKYWFRFSVDNGPLSESAGVTVSPIDGINNINTLPLGNIPIEKINSPGHQWIREYFLALVGKALGLVRGKFTSYPLMGGRTMQLNSSDLLSAANSDLDKLEDKLTKLLDGMVRSELAKRKKEQIEASLDVLNYTPMFIYVK